MRVPMDGPLLLTRCMFKPYHSAVRLPLWFSPFTNVETDAQKPKETAQDTQLVRVGASISTQSLCDKPLLSRSP